MGACVPPGRYRRKQQVSEQSFRPGHLQQALASGGGAFTAGAGGTTISGAGFHDGSRFNVGGGV
jgi:hypothetical protein